jgi:hypothetical protein
MNPIIIASLLVSSMFLTACKPDVQYRGDNYQDQEYQEGYGAPPPSYNHGSNLGSDLLKVGAGAAVGKMWSDHQHNKQMQQYGPQWGTPRNHWQRNDYGYNRPNRWDYGARRPRGGSISPTGWSSRPSRVFRSSPRVSRSRRR